MIKKVSKLEEIKTNISEIVDNNQEEVDQLWVSVDETFYVEDDLLFMTLSHHGDGALLDMDLPKSDLYKLISFCQDIEIPIEIM